MLNRKITLNMFITHISVQYMFIHMYQSNAHEEPWCMCKWNIPNGKMYTMNQMWILKAKKDILHSRYHMRYIVAAAAATDDVDTVFISDILWLYTMCNVYRKKRVDNSIHMKWTQSPICANSTTNIHLDSWRQSIFVHSHVSHIVFTIHSDPRLLFVLCRHRRHPSMTSV